MMKRRLRTLAITATGLLLLPSPAWAAEAPVTGANHWACALLFGAVLVVTCGIFYLRRRLGHR